MFVKAAAAAPAAAAATTTAAAAAAADSDSGGHVVNAKTKNVIHVSYWLKLKLENR